MYITVLVVDSGLWKMSVSQRLSLLESSAQRWLPRRFVLVVGSELELGSEGKRQRGRQWINKGLWKESVARSRVA